LKALNIRLDTGTMVKGGCADLRMWQRVKDGCGCGGHPPFT